jgi:hypothetical protein
MVQRLGNLDQQESLLINRLVSGNLSLNAKAVEAYKLADRIFAKSLRLNVRIHQRNILYFNLRRRQLQEKLAAFGFSAEELDREWRAKATEQTADEPVPNSPDSD